MLKLVYSRSRRDSTDAEDSRALGRALDEMTLGISPRLFIFEEHQAHVLFEVLRCYRFSQEDLDKWIQRLYADHPYIRARVSTAPRGLLGHLLNLPPRMVPTGETINDWIDRAGKFVNAVRESGDHKWVLKKPLEELQSLVSREARSSGRTHWPIVLMQWAIVHLFLIASETSLDESDR